MIFLFIFGWIVTGILSVFLFHRTLLCMDGRDWRWVDGDDIIWYVFLGSVIGYTGILLAIISSLAMFFNFIANLEFIENFRFKSFYIGKQEEDDE